MLDKKGQVSTFILDFEKAFDNPLMNSLKVILFSYGIVGKKLKWIDAFLCFRRQRGFVKGVMSDLGSSFVGCPTGHRS